MPNNIQTNTESLNQERFFNVELYHNLNTKKVLNEYNQLLRSMNAVFPRGGSVDEYEVVAVMLHDKIEANKKRNILYHAHAGFFMACQRKEDELIQIQKEKTSLAPNMRILNASRQSGLEYFLTSAQETDSLLGLYSGFGVGFALLGTTFLIFGLLATPMVIGAAVCLFMALATLIGCALVSYQGKNQTEIKYQELKVIDDLLTKKELALTSEIQSITLTGTPAPIEMCAQSGLSFFNATQKEVNDVSTQINLLESENRFAFA